MIRKVGLLLLLLPALYGQTGTSRIRGVVKDSSGAVAPGAEVVALHEATGFSRTIATNDAGQFSFDAMPLGLYTITVSLKGFKKFTSSANDLSVGDVLTIDVTLEPGAVTETVQVSASSVQVETSEASLGNVLETKPIEQLPLNGRNPLHLMALQPGVAGHAAQATSRSGTVTFYVNGDRGRGVFTTLDGVDVSDPVIPRGELAHVIINPDSVAEYRVITSVAKAEYGRNSGAQVQVVSRAGTNEFHGNLFEFHRNTAFNANDWFNNRDGIGREVLIRHQFGASIGGPIKKNTGFFFFNWQSQRLSQSISEVRTVLTPEARQGLFRFYVGARNAPTMVDTQGRPLVPACGGSVSSNCYRTYNMVLGDPQRRGLDPLMQTQIKLTNLPNDFSAGDGFNTARFRFNAAAQYPVDTTLARVDWRFGSNHQAYVRYGNGYNNLYGDYINTGLPRYPANPASYPGRTRESHSQGASLGFNSVLSANKVNEFNLGFTRNTIFFLDPTHPKFEIISNIQSDPFIFWGGTGRIPENSQVLDNFSFIKQNHTFKTGVNFRFYRINQFRRATNFYPRFTFGTTDAPVFLTEQAGSPQLDTTGINSNDRATLNSLFNDVMGVIGTVRKVFYSNGREFPSAAQELKFAQRTREYNFYFQDDWRVSPRLTLNLGVRYEFNSVPFDKSGMQVVADKPLDSRTGDVSLLPAGPGTGRTWYNNDWNNFAPTVGFAWTPFGTPKTSVRGGFRVAYNRLVSWALNVVEQNQPGTTKVKIIRPNSSSPTVRANDPAAQALVAQLPDGVVGLPVERTPAPDRSSTPLIFESNLRTPYVTQWNFSIQQQVLPNTVLELAYVGNKGTHMFRMMNGNQATVTPDFLASFLAAQRGVRTGPVGALLNTYGATASSVPSTITNALTNNDVAALITTVDTGVLNGVVGGRLVPAGLGQGYFRNPQFATAAIGCSCTDTSYNALQISMNRRFSGGLMFLTNYTFAKTLDDISDDTDGAGQGLLIPTDTKNRALDWGRADYDIRHQVRGAVIYDLPFGPGRRWLAHGGLLGRLVGGWTTNTIVDWSSGYPFSVSSGRGTLWPGITTRALFNGDPTSVGELVKGPTAVTFLSTEEKAAFSVPAPGQYGTGRNIFTGPGFFQTDFALHKNIPVTERVRIELRGEAFNVFNTPNFNQPNATATSASFGVISSLRVPPRIMQLAAKVYF